MKKEDLLRPCIEEKRGLKIEINNTKILYCLLLISLEVFPQVPVNGFCKFNHIDVDSGFTNLFTLNYNGDSYTDLVLFNPSKKEIETLDGNQSVSFSTPKKYKTLSEISCIHNVMDRNKKNIGYAYSSRKRMKVGLVSFAKNGKPLFTNEIKFDSYPENISTDDINGDLIPEYLISGKSFNGLSILTNQNRKLKENKIVRNSVYSFSLFTDISRDGFPDIAAFNLASLNIDLFYNKGNGEFYKVRSIPVSRNIYSLHSFDLDFDSVNDLIFSTENSIEILYGDYNSSFDVKKIIKTEYNPDKIIEGDFNHDGRMDIAYLDTKKGVLSVIFGKDNRDFYPEVIYFRKNGCTDLVPFYSRFTNGIAVINEHGALNFISMFNSVYEESDITLGINQQGINYFDHNHDGIPDLCFIDNAERKLDLVLRNSAGIPSLFYSVPLLSEESKIYPDNAEEQKVTFYCYNKGKKLIESVKIDFTNSSAIERKS
ncbi:MAG: VCBS repeat-containing protein, partial [Ignavibacteriaceae bacterium]|nr:VCBS repeat-containing protein [Ignavibacteriaceae bacterium]